MGDVGLADRVRLDQPREQGRPTVGCQGDERGDFGAVKPQDGLWLARGVDVAGQAHFRARHDARALLVGLLVHARDGGQVLGHGRLLAAHLGQSECYHAGQYSP